MFIFLTSIATVFLLPYTMAQFDIPGAQCAALCMKVDMAALGKAIVGACASDFNLKKCLETCKQPSILIKTCEMPNGIFYQLIVSLVKWKNNSECAEKAGNMDMSTTAGCEALKENMGCMEHIIGFMPEQAKASFRMTGQFWRQQAKLGVKANTTVCMENVERLLHLLDVKVKTPENQDNESQSANGEDQNENNESQSANGEDQNRVNESQSANGEDQNQNNESQSANGEDQNQNNESQSANGEDQNQNNESQSANGEDQNQNNESQSANGEDQNQNNESQSANGEDQNQNNESQSANGENQNQNNESQSANGEDQNQNNESQSANSEAQNNEDQDEAPQQDESGIDRENKTRSMCSGFTVIIVSYVLKLYVGYN